MDFTSLIAGPAQAGPQSPVSKPGIGFTAGAGSSPAADAAADDGFASLVAAALAPHDGVSTTSGRGSGEGVVDDSAAELGGDDPSPLDASADAATLSLLIALTTPVATAPASTPQPDVTVPGVSDAESIGADVAGAAPTAPADATDTRASVPPPTAARAAAPAFEDVLASASPGADAPAATMPAAPDAAAGAAPIAATTTPETPATPADAVATSIQPANAPPPSAGPGAAAAPPVGGTARAGQRAAAHPLRQALAAMAAAAPADPASPSATQPGAATATPQTAAPVASAPAAAAGTNAHEARAAVVSRDVAAAAAPVATFAAASDAGAAGDGSSNDAPGGFAGATSWAPFRGAGSRLDLSAGSLVSAAGPAEMATGAPLPSTAGFGAGAGVGFGATGDTMLRAIDVPAAARFEQTLSSVDPDVRNLQAMVRTVRLFTAGSGAHEARLTLEPEHLGHVGLTVRVEQGSVSAHFRAETPAAQRWIETHQQELRDGLREQGLEVKDVVVTTDPDGRRERRQDAQAARLPRARRPQGADTPRFEVLV